MGGGENKFIEIHTLSEGFAGNTINSPVFRKNAIVSHYDKKNKHIYQYCSFYNSKAKIVIGMRVNDGPWKMTTTEFEGSISDAHNAISMAVDGNGYLHMAWSNHAGKLFYVRSIEPNSIKCVNRPLIGSLENDVTYPEFYLQSSGSILMIYRSGISGNGNIILNRYDPEKLRWERLYDNLISGEGEVSPYWQACVDNTGRLHISWCWRKTGDVASNYNICYAVSSNEKCDCFYGSDGELKAMPMTRKNSDTILEIPTGSMLINQTSMTTDENGRAYISSYWRENGIVQYFILYQNGREWIKYNTGIRSDDFDMAGTGTKFFPCSRPQILMNKENIYILFRDEKYGSTASIAHFRIKQGEIQFIHINRITDMSLEAWEPNYDIEYWNKFHELFVFIQKEYYQRDGTEFDKEDNINEMVYIYHISLKADQ